ncbi:Retrovirus-related Pol polyprotein from transposon [Smittium culicis]|uniref:Retrovirus-related Pol polyprotein from transposon n=1 Tax=Smittium culicis TaxID=133412 RepID=A0A1R1XT70_9FUNG|nr:Retrovirus-related Pol polyprotein from transposon [Smittium culicis]
MEPSARANPKTSKDIKMPDNKEKASNLPKIFPGTSGAPVFSGEGLTEFLTFYDIITANSSSKEKTQLFPYYCDKSIRDKIIKSIPYYEGNWVEFKSLLNDYYEIDECEKVLTDELKKLVQKGTSLHDIKIFLHTFEYLVKKLDKYTTTNDREKREMLIKSIYPSDFFKIQSSIYDNEGSLLCFDEMVKKLKSLNTMHRTLDEIRGNNPNKIPIIESVKDAKELDTMTKMFEKMCLKMDAVIETISTAKTTDIVTDKYKRNVRCIYCDEPHRRVDCNHFKDDNEAGLVKMGSEGFIENSSGVRMPTNWGKGGIRTLIKSSQATSRHIKLGAPEKFDFALEWEKDTESKIITETDFSKLVNAFASKRTLDNSYFENTTNKKGKSYQENSNNSQDDTPLIDRVEEINIRNNIENESINNMLNPAYKMTSKIVSKDCEKIVSEKLQEVQVSLTLKELFSVSPSIRKKFNEDIRTRREPIVNLTSYENISSPEEINYKPIDVDNTSSNWKEFYLSTGSGKVKGCINGAGVEFLLDEGSEINIMNIDVFNALRSLNKIEIDSSINWSLRDANQGFSKLNGVCKECKITIEGTTVTVPVFVSENTEPQVILGRPWERKARVLKDNRDDGTLWYTIKDADTGAIAKFCAVGPYDSRSYPDNKNKPFIKNDNNITNFTLVNRIDAGWKAITKTEYTTEVRTRYKKANEKIKSVPHALPPYNSSIQEIIPNKNSLKIITDEKLAELCIGNDNLLPTEIEYFKTKLKPLRNVFAFNENEIGLLDTTIEDPITVHTIPHIPWSLKSYPQPKAIWEKIKSLIKAKMEQGVLEPSRGSYSNRWFCINKKNSDKLRFIQDVRPVNEVTIKNSSVPPVAEEFAEDFAGRTIYTTFDLISGYDQVQISESSRDLFALQTPLGLLRMTRLPMGWSNSVQEFQRIMYKIFFKFIPEKMGLFIDDGCIKGSRNKDLKQDIIGVRNFVKDHIKDVVEILSTLQDTGMTVNAKKCKFGVSEVEIVGFICSEKGRRPVESKIKKILDWPIPSNLKELRGFLGLTCFYRVWIKNYSVIADPLYLLLRKDIIFEWSNAQNIAFEKLKLLITTPPILQAPKYDEDSGKFILTIDASPVGAGGVLHQINQTGELNPCRFESYCFNERERRNDSKSVWRFISEDILSRFGIVNKLVADRGEVNSNLIKDLANKYGLKLSFTTSYHPQTNGMVERGHSPLVSSLSKYCGRNPSQWPKFLHLALWADRITAKRTTGETPYKLVYGQDCILPIENEFESWNKISWKKEMTTEELLFSRIQQLDKKTLLIDKASKRQKDSRKKDVEYFNNKHKIRDTPLMVGDMVLQYDNTLGKQREQKLSNRWYGPFVITKDNNNGSYNIRELNGVDIKLPIAGNRLKRYFSEEDLILPVSSQGGEMS